MDGTAGENPQSKPNKGAKENILVEGQDPRTVTDLAITEDDLLEAREAAATLSLEDVEKVHQTPLLICFYNLNLTILSLLQIMTQAYAQHKQDPNFSVPLLHKIEQFLGKRPPLPSPN